MKPPVRYYGGKTRLAPWLASLMPELPVYVEVFTGSAAVLLARPQVRHEILNDRDGNVVTFFRVLRDRPDELIEALQLTPYARDEFQACQAANHATALEPASCDVERARRFFTTVMQSFAATTARRTGWSWSTRNNTSRPRSTHHYIDRLEAIAVRLQQVLVENVEAAELLERHAGDPDVVLYLDPPYLDSVRRNDGRDGQGYALDANTPDDHRRWAEALTDARAAVFISGYPSGLYDELYDGWYQTSTSVRTDLGNRGARTEVVWSNRPIAPQRLAL